MISFSNFVDDDSAYAMIKRIKLEPEAMLSQEDDLMAQLQQDSSDLEVEPSFSLEGATNDDEECIVAVLMQHMEIREPLSTLRSLLEAKLQIDLSDYSFWLQDAQMVKNILYKEYYIEISLWFQTCNTLYVCYNSWRAIKLWQLNASKDKEWSKLVYK